MVATDIFGRGIDIVKVNTVINYDMPDSPDSYMHRVGRAGRFGGKGLTITFISEKEDEAIFDEIQKRFLIKAQALPDEIDPSTYSKLYLSFILFRLNYLIRFYLASSHPARLLTICKAKENIKSSQSILFPQKCLFFFYIDV